MSCTFWNLRRRQKAQKKAVNVAQKAEIQEEVKTEEKKPVKKAGAKNDNGTSNKS